MRGSLKEPAPQHWLRGARDERRFSAERHTPGVLEHLLCQVARLLGMIDQPAEKANETSLVLLHQSGEIHWRQRPLLLADQPGCQRTKVGGSRCGLPIRW